MTEINETEPSVADELLPPSDPHSLRDFKDALLLPLSSIEDDMVDEDEEKKRFSKRKKNKAKKIKTPLAPAAYQPPAAETETYAADYADPQAPIQPEDAPCYYGYPYADAETVDPYAYPYADGQTTDPYEYPYADAETIDPYSYPYADGQTADPYEYPYADGQTADPYAYPYADAETGVPADADPQEDNADDTPYEAAAAADEIPAQTGDDGSFEQPAEAQYPPVQTVRIHRDDYLDRTSALYVPPQTRPKFQELFGTDRFLSVMSLVSVAACFVWTFVYFLMLAKRESMFSQMVLQMAQEGHYAFTATFSSPVLTFLKIALFLIPVVAFVWMFAVVRAEKVGAFIGNKKIIFAVIAVFFFIGAMAVYDLARAGLVFDVAKF